MPAYGLPLKDVTLVNSKVKFTDKNVDAIQDKASRKKLFGEEIPGWKGYIEWEKYPEKKAKAKEILNRYQFPPPPEYQLSPMPDTNPIIEGVRWKMWHKAIGGDLFSVPELSWLQVIEEKHPDMLHLLQFPYNGEPPKVTSDSFHSANAESC